MDILNQLAIWAQIIYLPVAIIAIVVTVWFFYKGKQKKAISCVFDQIEFPIEVKAGEALDGEIEIRYKGKPVKNIFLVRVKIKNTGNLPIRRSDVIEPLTFTFEPDVVILREPRIIEQNPQNLKATWEPNRSNTSSKAIGFLFDLLNPNDEVSAEFICAGNPQLPKTTARIEGVSNIDSSDPEEKVLKKAVTDGLEMPMIIVISILVSVISNYFSISQIKIPPFLALGFIIVIILFFVGLIALYIWVKTIKPLVKLFEYKRRQKQVKK
jgi:hypothetical protein